MAEISKHPGANTEPRGLDSFSESERNRFTGRETQCEQLASLLADAEFRAGLLYGESGVGKTSFLQAGLVPLLREQGILAVISASASVADLTEATHKVTSIPPRSTERIDAYLTRVISDESSSSHSIVFILDEIDSILDSSAEQHVNTLKDVFTRVVSRGNGRAKFLFCCDRAHIYVLDRLERKTGSLFPPESRYELPRFDATTAVSILRNELGYTNRPFNESLPTTIVSKLEHKDGVLAADMQIALLVVASQNIVRSSELDSIEGPSGFYQMWIRTAAEATTQKSDALRFLAAMTEQRTRPMVTQQTLDILKQKKLLRILPCVRDNNQNYVLAHPVVHAHIPLAVAAAVEKTQTAEKLLRTRATQGKPLAVGEWLQIRRAGIVPQTRDEESIVVRSQRRLAIVGGLLIIVPTLVLLWMYLGMTGKYYLDVWKPPNEQPQRIVVRAGSPSLSWFHWLPHTPSFGSIIADTGITMPMVTQKRWQLAKQHQYTGVIEHGYIQQTYELLSSTTGVLLQYAMKQTDASLQSVLNTNDEQETVVLLQELQPLARGGVTEKRFVQQALHSSSPVLQREALEVIASALKRIPDSYTQILTDLLTSKHQQIRRRALALATTLPTATTLMQNALASNSHADVREELITAIHNRSKTIPEQQLDLLAHHELQGKRRQEVQAYLRRMFLQDPTAATKASIKLAVTTTAHVEDRLFALNLIADQTPNNFLPKIAKEIVQIREEGSESLQAAVLPLYARIHPKQATKELAQLLARKELDIGLTLAMTRAWGDIARTKETAAQAALQMLLKHKSFAVRSAAARSYGFVGGSAQETLTKIIKRERFPVALGAAYGLANSVSVQAPSTNAVAGIARLWKRQGKSQREATKVFAYLARRHPNVAYGYLAKSARNEQSAALRKIGVEGLCHAAAAGHRRSQSLLTRATQDPTNAVRLLVAQCALRNLQQPQMAARIANRLQTDETAEIRIYVAKILAELAQKGRTTKQLSKALVTLVSDENQQARMAAIHGLAAIGNDAPSEASTALLSAFPGADHQERLVLLEAAKQLKVVQLLRLGLQDASSQIRIAAIRVALHSETDRTFALNIGLTDTDREVRRSTLLELANQRNKVPQQLAERFYALFLADIDPDIRYLALTTMASMGNKQSALSHIETALRSRSERERARAAESCIGLVDRDPRGLINLLEPHLHDPARDVRVATISPLARAYAATNSPKQLEKMLLQSETNALRRLVATAAFVVLSKSDVGRNAAIASLTKTSEHGTDAVRFTANLGKNLIEHHADGVGFLSQLTP